MTPRKEDAPVKTITCQHCRYERPAKDARCHICGYPWTFAEEKSTTTSARRKAAGKRAQE